MKHILFGLAAVLFASSVALADDQLTAQVKPASAEAAQPSAPVPAKVPSGAAAAAQTNVPLIRGEGLRKSFGSLEVL